MLLAVIWSFGGWGVSLTRPVLESVWSFDGWGVSLTRPVLKSLWSFVGWGVSLVHAPYSNLTHLSSDGETLTGPKLESVSSVGGYLF